MTCLRRDTEVSLPVNRLLVIVLYFHMGSAFWAFFLDNELILSLHGAEGLQLCWTTWQQTKETQA